MVLFVCRIAPLQQNNDQVKYNTDLIHTYNYNNEVINANTKLIVGQHYIIQMFCCQSLLKLFYKNMNSKKMDEKYLNLQKMFM